MTPHLRKEIMKADVYKARLKFLQENNITTADDLTACLQQAENEVTQLAKQRTILNVRKKKRKSSLTRWQQKLPSEDLSQRKQNMTMQKRFWILAAFHAKSC